MIRQSSLIKEIGGEFEIYVNESDMAYLSDSRAFNEYSIEDVIGTEWFNSIKEQNPELL
jgi:hypothetical protein